LNLEKLDINNLSFGDKENPGFSIPFLSADFSLPDLYKGNIKKITISGMVLKIEQTAKGWTFKGLDPLFKQQGEGKPIVIGDLTVNSSVIHLRYSRLDQPMHSPPDRGTVIPFQLNALYRGESKSYKLSVSIHPFGDTIQINGELDPEKGNGKFNITADSLRLQNMIAETGLLPDLFLKTRARLSASLILKNWGLSQCSVNMDAAEFKCILPQALIEGSLKLGFSISNSFDLSDISFQADIKRVLSSLAGLEITSPFTFSVEGKGEESLVFKCSPISPAAPYGIRIANVAGKISGLPESPSLKGALLVEIPTASLSRFLPMGKVVSKMPLVINSEFSLSTGTTSGLTGTTSGLTGTTPGLTGADDSIAWTFKGKGRGRQLSFLSPLPAESLSKCRRLDLDITASGVGLLSKSSFKLNAEGLTLKFKDFIFSAERVFLGSTLKDPGVGNFIGSGRLKIVSALFHDKSKSLINTGRIDIDLPWDYPFTRTNIKNPTGSINIASMDASGFRLGKINGEVRQENGSFNISGTVNTALEHVKVILTGFVTPPSHTRGTPLKAAVVKEGLDFSVGFSIPQPRESVSLEMEKLNPMFEGMKLAGRFSGSGKISSNSADESGMLTSNAFFSLKDGSLVMAQPGAVTGDELSIDGLNVQVKIDDLFEFTSEKNQLLTFKNLSALGFPVTDGRVTFELEGPGSFFVESGEFSCLNGRIITAALRYNMGTGDIKTILYCDRLDFDRVMNILMEKEVAYGNAELNGIIPINLSRGIPLIKKGYLYSTPGIKGNIKFTDSSVISGGVLLVEEAVKDFNYNWIKVKMNSKKDRLNVTVFIEGAPAGKLPLKLDTKTNDLVRDPSGKRNVELKGLTLELRLWDIDMKSLMSKGSKIFSNK
ncbi:MAG: hypothetical protein GY757_12580, partial [bacterium]|nr:hypothetical protein [bacterium]